MSRKVNPIVYVAGAGVLAYLFLNKSAVPGSTSAPSLLNNLLPSSTPTTYGINAGTLLHNDHDAVQNYAQLTTANPNLLNSNYQMSAGENAQYGANYLDLRQGLASWPGGYTPANLQKHWGLYGVADQRIFLPLVPTSNGSFIVPPANPKTSAGGGIFGTILKAVTTIGPSLVALAGPEDQLNDTELNLIVTSALIFKKILPFFAIIDKSLVISINNKIDSLLTQYEP
ncbi:MAG: hypothetical protein ACREOZ_02625 [Gloeomargaritales cyanobacterium]